MEEKRKVYLIIDDKDVNWYYLPTSIVRIYDNLEEARDFVKEEENFAKTESKYCSYLIVSTEIGIEEEY